MANISELNKTKVYADFHGFEQLKSQARKNSPEALERVAKQFEQIFLQMVMKSMRSANSMFKEGSLLESNTTDFYQDMYDQQLTLNMAHGKGFGLADVLVRQLGKHTQSNTDASTHQIKDLPVTNSIAKTTPAEKVSSSDSTEKATTKLFSNPVEFVKSLWPEALEVAKKIGVDPKMLIAQAALETGWGKAIIKDTNGDTSHNLFNIKAGKSWQDDIVSVTTLEYEKGLPVKRYEPFRKYDSFAESFSDYVSLLQNFSRYKSALDNSDDPKAYIHALQEAGYATDPNYAKKVYSIYKSETLNNALNELEVN